MIITEVLHNIDKTINDVNINIINQLIDPRIRARIEKIQLEENDPFGIDLNTVKVAGIFSHFMYKFWNRVEVFGIENVPDKGAAILIPNHGGVIPLDATYIGSSLMIEKENPRLVRTLVERFLPNLPFVYNFMTRVGQVVGTYENAELILKSGNILQIFPEGAKGASKPYYKYYELDEFNVGFMELAIRNKVPIIPVGVTGSHEQAMVLFDFKILAKLFNIPTFPITAVLPLLGPAGAFPLPAKFRIIFGKPMDFSSYSEDILDNPDEVKKLVDSVKKEVKNLVDVGLDMRPFPFL